MCVVLSAAEHGESPRAYVRVKDTMDTRKGRGRVSRARARGSFYKWAFSHPTLPPVEKPPVISGSSVSRPLPGLPTTPSRKYLGVCQSQC